MLETQAVQTSEDKFLLHNLVKRDPRAGLAEDVRRGLSSKPKRFLPKYFYDQLGSQLFEAICLLPEYYLTRAENEILERYADEIVSSVAGDITLIEMGSGSASKTRLIGTPKALEMPPNDRRIDHPTALDERAAAIEFALAERRRDSVRWRAYWRRNDRYADHLERHYQ